MSAALVTVFRTVLWALSHQTSFRLKNKFKESKEGRESPSIESCNPWRLYRIAAMLILLCKPCNDAIVCRKDSQTCKLTIYGTRSGWHLDLACPCPWVSCVTTSRARHPISIADNPCFYHRCGLLMRRGIFKKYLCTIFSVLTFVRGIWSLVNTLSKMFYIILDMNSDDMFPLTCIRFQNTEMSTSQRILSRTWRLLVFLSKAAALVCFPVFPFLLATHAQNYHQRTVLTDWRYR